MLAAILLTSGYLAMVLFVVLVVFGTAIGKQVVLDSALLMLLLKVNLGLLIWRVAARAGFVSSVYGWREGLLSVPRILVANIIAIMAARRAVFQYARMLKTGRLVWDKTAHVFPQRAENG